MPHRCVRIHSKHPWGTVSLIGLMAGLGCGTDPVGNSADQQGRANPPAPAASPVALSFSGFSPGMPFGTFAQPNSAFGEVYTAGMRNIIPDSLLSNLEAIKSRGGRVVLMFAGNERNYKDAEGNFILSMWKARVDRFRGVDFSVYVEDGTIIGHYLIDEPSDPSNWNGQRIPGSTVEEMAEYSKSIWPTMVTIVRAEPSYMAGWSGTYRYLDAAWVQYAERKGDIPPYLARNVADAKAKGLAMVVGLNVLLGALGATEPTAAQVESWGNQLMEEPYSCAFISWQYNAPFLERPDIKAVMEPLARRAAERSFKTCRGAGSETPPPPPPPPPEEDPPANQPPTAAFNAPNCTVDASCRFSEGSGDSDGSITGWSWDFGDGSTSEAREPSHTYTRADRYTVTLTVTDNDGATGTVALDVLVATAPNAAPTAAFRAPSCTVGLPCQFTDGSSDSDGSIAAWSWDFGGGSTAAVANPSPTFGAQGSRGVSLSVTDDGGATSTVTHSVSVVPAAPPPPSPIVLNLAVMLQNGVYYVNLTWTGASGALVDVYRNGVFSQATANDGLYSRAPWSTQYASYTYKICETGSSRCSNKVTANYPGARISLTATASGTGTLRRVTLLWAGLRGTSVDIYRNSRLLVRTTNSGRYITARGGGGVPGDLYKVCEARSSTCSRTVTAR